MDVVFRTQKDGNAIALIVVQTVGPDDWQCARHRDGKSKNALPLHARESRDRQEGEDVNHRGAQVWLLQNQQSGHCRQQRGNQEIFEGSSFAPWIIVKELGEGDDDANLGVFAGLERKTAEVDPTNAAANVFAKDEHEQQREDATRVHDVPKSLEVAVIDRDENAAENAAEHEPVDLTDVQLGSGRNTLVDARRAVEVHDAEHSDERDGDEQRPVKVIFGARRNISAKNHGAPPAVFPGVRPAALVPARGPPRSRKMRL